MMALQEWIVTRPLGKNDQAAYLGARQVMVRATSAEHARERGANQMNCKQTEVTAAPNPGGDGTGDIRIIPGPYGK